MARCSHDNVIETGTAPDWHGRFQVWEACGDCGRQLGPATWDSLGADGPGVDPGPLFPRQYGEPW